MAVTRKKVATASKKGSSKTSNNGVVKRPARGFHRFRNGILNVTPKGGELELVITNQDSLLLRLPGELRTRIWEYVLGGFELRSMFLNHTQPSTPARMIPPLAERRNGTQLLRTCRQIYSETALLPYKTNTFVFETYTPVKYDLKRMKAFQRAHIEKIQFDVDCQAGDTDPYKLMFALGKDNLEVLPSLKHVHVVAFCCHGRHDPGFSDEMKSVEAVIRNILNVGLVGRQLKSTCEVRVGSTYFEGVREWESASPKLEDDDSSSSDVSSSSE